MSAEMWIGLVMAVVAVLLLFTLTALLITCLPKTWSKVKYLRAYPEIRAFGEVFEERDKRLEQDRISKQPPTGLPH
jgi:hypothetical protein